VIVAPHHHRSWRAQPNAAHLAACLQAHIAQRGHVCHGMEPDGSEPHPSDLLLPALMVPVSAGGDPFGQVMVFCPGHRRQFQQILEQVLHLDDQADS
jgi:hypothetical protein